ncbi:hypothetical protein SAMN02910292_02665 [Lachnospiraceae bacterium XBB2008]|nr:hypothetical protein SAMN02910292_02665 [Lachnospiraceae bacterium XBB2008]
MEKIDQQKTVAIGQFILDLIREMDQANYELCVYQLYDFLDFNVLSPEDIRREDLAEKVISTIKTDVSRLGIKPNEILSYYTCILGVFRRMYINVRENSRADQYRSLEISKMKALYQDNEDHASLEDIVVIFLSFFRVLKEWEYREDVLIQDLNIGITTEDITIIHWLNDNCHLPVRIDMENDQSKKKTTKTVDYSRTNTSIFYIFTMLMYCHLLSENGIS